jgi:hypothetical protein
MPPVGTQCWPWGLSGSLAGALVDELEEELLPPGTGFWVGGGSSSVGSSSFWSMDVTSLLK